MIIFLLDRPTTPRETRTVNRIESEYAPISAFLYYVTGNT